MEWLDPAVLIRPVEAFWRTIRNGEESIIRLDIDLQGACDTTAKLEKWCDTMWYSVWAPLITSNTQCIAYGITPLTVGGPGLLFPPEFRYGSRLPPAASKSSAIVWNMWGGGPQSRQQRRLYISFGPISDQIDQQLTDGGMARHLTAARSLVEGCNGDQSALAGRLIVWRKARPAIGYAPYEPPRWLPLEQVVVNSYLDKAPDVG